MSVPSARYLGAGTGSSLGRNSFTPARWSRVEPHRLQHRQKRWHRELSRVTTSEAIVVDQAHKVYVAAYLSTVRCQHRPRAAVVMATMGNQVILKASSEVFLFGADLLRVNSIRFQTQSCVLFVGEA